MSTFDAVTDAAELMRVWSDSGSDAATDHLSGLPDERREVVVLGMVNLLGSVLCLREKERGVTPAQTLQEVVSRPWDN
jgi:hypothetical protein